MRNAFQPAAAMLHAIHKLAEIGSRFRGMILVLIALLFALSPCVASAAGLTPEENATIYRELQEPIQVKLKNKRTIPGHSINVSGETLQIGTSEGAGEIIFTFQVDEVDSFSIPGESYKTLVVEWIESGDTEKALELIELLYMQRVQLIPLLPASESNFFTYYIDLILASDNPARAIAVTEILRPQIESPAALRALDDAILESYHKLELHDEALPLAQAWVASRTPYGASALGYYVLGTSALRKEAYNEALDLALQPIVFSSPVITEKIAHCYAVAVSAALGLREKDYAITLYQEMLQRELSWPENDKTLAPFHQTILKEITDT
jgi:tetratricopeptide (TPR) repeat protein